MKKVNYKKIAEDYNTWKNYQGDKIFTPSMLREELKAIGINSSIAQEMMKHSFFQKERQGCRVFIKVNTKCIPNYETFEKLFDSFNASRRKTMDEETAINFLKQKGYRIQAPVGIDYKQLIEENPELASRYTTFKEI